MSDRRRRLILALAVGGGVLTPAGAATEPATTLDAKEPRPEA